MLRQVGLKVLLEHGQYVVIPMAEHEADGLIKSWRMSTCPTFLHGEGVEGIQRYVWAIDTRRVLGMHTVVPEGPPPAGQVHLGGRLPPGASGLN